MSNESFPCIICGRRLTRVTDHFEGQPNDGIMCHSGGNYGSTVYDPMDGRRLAFNICDPCVKKKAEEGVIYEYVQHRQVEVTDFGICGIDNGADFPYVQWKPGLPGYDRYTIDIEDLRDWSMRHEGEVTWGGRTRFEINFERDSIIEHVEYRVVNNHVGHVVLDMLTAGGYQRRKPCLICEQLQDTSDGTIDPATCKHCGEVLLNIGAHRWVAIEHTSVDDRWLVCDKSVEGEHEVYVSEYVESVLREVREDQ